MKRLTTTFMAALALAAFGWLGAGPATAGGGGPDNVVNVTTTGTNAVQERSSTRVGSYGGDDLESTNLARADSHDCTDCRTVAVAFQAVFATGHPHTWSPKNFALATNENCTRCTTFAWAYQYDVATSGPVHLTADERSRLADLRSQIDDAAGSDLAPPDLDARLRDLATQFKAEIDADVANSGEHGHGHVHQDESSPQD